jgi:hypothetical protein
VGEEERKQYVEIGVEERQQKESHLNHKTSGDNDEDKTQIFYFFIKGLVQKGLA